MRRGEATGAVRSMNGGALRNLGAIVLSLWMVLCGGASAQTELVDRWMAVYMQGEKVGHAHMRTVRKGRGDKKRYVTHMTQEYAIRRGNTEMHIRVQQRITENGSGRVLSFMREMSQGPINQKTTGTLEDGQWVIRSGEGSSRVKQTAEAPEVLGPWAVERISRSRGYNPGTQYSLPVFTTQAPTRKVTAEVAVGEKKKKQIGEIQKWLHRVEVELSMMPGMETVEWVDEKGTVWMTEATMGPLELKMKRCSERVARESDGGTAEIMVSTAITPDRPIKNPRSVSRMRVVLLGEAVKKADESDVALKLPDTMGQSVQQEDGRITVITERPEIPSGEIVELPYSGSDMKRYLMETPWLEINDSNIRRMSRRAVGEEKNAVKAARKIERYVGKVIEEKTLGMGFATAAETARQKAGDCTEHALLAAALARAAGLPSRVTCGLAYGGPLPGDTRRRFYFHMWTEVYAGKWLPIDAALGSFDGTHIAMAHSDLARHDAVIDIRAAIMEVMGTLELNVRSIRH